jgi:hypothetical protein
MASGAAIRGSRVGAGPLGESERGQSIQKKRVSYWCADGHESRVAFAFDVEVEAIPESWDCPKCGLPAGQNKENPPIAPKNEPYKTHLAYVKERRSESESAIILHKALATLKDEMGE